jgi:ubiquinone/menaquinone biosynthesis C-methylase UbiE
MTTLPAIHRYLPLAIKQSLGRGQFDREIEPEAVMDQEDNVDQYDQVMSTKLAIVYAIALELIHRIRSSPYGGAAVDLACGPGHFSLLLVQHLRLNHLYGCDLSEKMIQRAIRNAHVGNLDKADFRKTDILDLSVFADDQFDLSTFNDAAHHFEADDVERVLLAMDRITKPSGVVYAMDLARLRSAGLTQKYCELVGEDYINRGLPAFYRDFVNSMKAAWTTSELRRLVPENTKRDWFQLVPAGLPTIQVILGIPHGRKRVFVRGCSDAEIYRQIVPLEMRWEWRLARSALNWGSASRLNAQR